LAPLANKKSLCPKSKKCTYAFLKMHFSYYKISIDEQLTLGSCASSTTCPFTHFSIRTLEVTIFDAPFCFLNVYIP